MLQIIHASGAGVSFRTAADISAKTSLALVQQHHATAWNRGHQAGIRAAESAVKQATDAVKADAWGNTQLTNALMQAEAERDQLRAQLAKAVASKCELLEALEATHGLLQATLIIMRDKEASAIAKEQLDKNRAAIAKATGECHD